MPISRRGGGVTKRCECRGPGGKLLGASCPLLAKKNHGRPAVRQELPPGEDGKRRTFRRTGYDSVKDAQADLDRIRAILDLADDDDADEQRRVGDLLTDVAKRRLDMPEPAQVAKQLGNGQLGNKPRTVGELLDEWMAAKQKSRRATTVNGYASHVRVHLRPALASYRADRLSVGQVQAMFDAIDDQNDVTAAENAARREQAQRCKWTKPGRPPAAERARLKAEREKLAEMPPFRKITSLASQHAIRRSLRAAVNWGMKRPEYGITFNAAAHVDLTPYRRPKGLLWTAERVAHWRATGEIPSPVMVWTPAQLGAYLDAAESSRLYAAFHLMAYHGLRRGEAVGADWVNLDARHRLLTIASEITVDGWTPIETAPKTDGSASAVRLDTGTVAVLQAHQLRQLAERDAQLEEQRERQRAGKEPEDAPPAWTDTGKMFTRPDGTWLHPEELSDEFRRIAGALGLPPVNLRDLRHGAAALVKAGGGDLEDAKTLLRHSTIVLTSDTYMALFEEAEEELAERRVAVVPRARKGGSVSAEA